MKWQLRERWQAAQQARRRLQGIPKFVTQIAHEFMTEGAATIETRFTYQPTIPHPTDAANRTEATPTVTGVFRTCIQLDGDVLNIIPPPDLYPNDTAWSATLQTQWVLHQAKVKSFFNQLNAFRMLSEKIMNRTGTLTGMLIAFNNDFAKAVSTDLPIWLHIALLIVLFLGIGGLIALLFSQLLRPLLIGAFRHYIVYKIQQ